MMHPHARRLAIREIATSHLQVVLHRTVKGERLGVQGLLAALLHREHKTLLPDGGAEGAKCREAVVHAGRDGRS